MALLPDFPVILVGPKGDEFRCFYTVDYSEKLAEGYKVKDEPKSELPKPVAEAIEKMVEDAKEEKKPARGRPARRTED